MCPPATTTKTKYFLFGFVVKVISLRNTCELKLGSVNVKGEMSTRQLSMNTLQYIYCNWFIFWKIEHFFIWLMVKLVYNFVSKFDFNHSADTFSLIVLLWFTTWSCKYLYFRSSVINDHFNTLFVILPHWLVDINVCPIKLKMRPIFSVDSTSIPTNQWKSVENITLKRVLLSFF